MPNLALRAHFKGTVMSALAGAAGFSALFMAQGLGSLLSTPDVGTQLAYLAIIAVGTVVAAFVSFGLGAGVFGIPAAFALRTMGRTGPIAAAAAGAVLSAGVSVSLLRPPYDSSEAMLAAAVAFGGALAGLAYRRYRGPDVRSR